MGARCGLQSVGGRPDLAARAHDGARDGSTTSCTLARAGLTRRAPGRFAELEPAAAGADAVAESLGTGDSRSDRDAPVLDPSPSLLCSQRLGGRGGQARRSAIRRAWRSSQSGVRGRRPARHWPSPPPGRRARQHRRADRPSPLQSRRPRVGDRPALGMRLQVIVRDCGDEAREAAE